MTRQHQRLRDAATKADVVSSAGDAARAAAAVAEVAVRTAARIFLLTPDDRVQTRNGKTKKTKASAVFKWEGRG